MNTENLTGIIKVLFPTYTFVSALVVAACLTPTDPIICAAIVGQCLYLTTACLPAYIDTVTKCLTDGKYAESHVPEDLRHILSAKSAANDSLAYPFLSIAIYLTVEESKKVAIGKWFLVGWFCTSTVFPVMIRCDM